MEDRVTQEPLRLADGRVVVNGQVIHRPPVPTVREFRHVNFARVRDPLRAAIARVLYG